MGSTGSTPDSRSLTPRQQKWFASVQEGLARDTGKTIEEWVVIAQTCPETKPKARSEWLRVHHGLGANRGAYVLSMAFPSAAGWDEPETLRAALWTDPASLAILTAVEAAVAGLPALVHGQRKGFTAFSREFQFAATRPLKGGEAVLGLAVGPEASLRLSPAAAKDGWSERLKARIVLASPAEVDVDLTALLRQAWERS
ncbi:DUF4287 domain-containing protein [Phenylobacterium aquaticum]|uniref:DUF4287 domain-containing protein n=1 Tax=Phenylobacterium aquaticum TaxID=1763816 RepID=UPI0026ED4734|nr:DUF4287 domain-containing protein [Phenylobacterium aquaticum]